MSILLSPEQVAKLLQVSDQTIINMCKRGEIDYVKAGKQYRVFQDTVERLLGRRLGPGEVKP